ncbi:hypothetical protein CNY89_29670, partial [Amaricoccus sp. HAR-UPW-R2A-40]
GTALDPFGRTEERRMERGLIAEYEADIDRLQAALTPETRAVALARRSTRSGGPRSGGWSGG